MKPLKKLQTNNNNKYTMLTISMCFFVVFCTHHIKPAFSPIQNETTIIKDLTFFPINGYRFRLSELKDVRAIVMVMRKRECPVSKKYGPRLARLERKYSKKGVLFIYNYVGQTKPKESAFEDLKRFGFKGPYVIDSKQTVVNTLGVKTTGEIFIFIPLRSENFSSYRRGKTEKLKPNQYTIIYRGPVDDQHHLLKLWAKPWLTDALEDIISGGGEYSIAMRNISAPGCIINQPVIKEKILWRDVAPIIKKKCTTCHNPSGSGPINYVKYEDVVGRQAMFKYVIENDLMPPWFVDPNTGPWENNLTLDQKEKSMILKWISDGSPRDSLKKPQILWTQKRVPKEKSDYIIPIPERVLIPAEGVFNYKRFIISTPFNEDKWIKDVKFRLKPKVIHHAFLYIMESSFNPFKKGIHSDIRKYSSAVFGAAGSKLSYTKTTVSEEIGYKLPRNAKLVLEVHYEPIGQKIIDNYTQVHINFLKKKPKYKTVTYTISASDNRINIPPHALNYTIKASYKIKETMILKSVYPHMHLRGKANAVFIITPQGEKRKIFGLDPFIVKFERGYFLKDPIQVSKGSIVECINWFDNSNNNPINPNPDVNVVYGKFKKDEMSLCHFGWLVPIDKNIKSQWIKVLY